MNPAVARSAMEHRSLLFARTGGIRAAPDGRPKTRRNPMRKFRLLWSASVLALALSPGLAAASEADTFVGVLRRFGVSVDNVLASKKPCLCFGGSLAGQVGALMVSQIGGGNSFVAACYILRFDGAGAFQSAANCESAGGTYVVLGK
jgi:hypothetical protein